MRHILSALGLITALVATTQTIEEIDKLKVDILENLDQYERLDYENNKILNENAHQYDSANFYQDSNGDLVYMRWQSRGHTFHISGDDIDIIEFVFIDGKAVFRKDFGYYFKNPQWHLEPDINETEVFVAESIRRYFNKDGSAIMDYESRTTEGKYKDRFTLLDSIPLEEVRRLIWTDRCDECIEEDYLSIYRKLLEEKGE